jgi:hypothetical protein
MDGVDLEKYLKCCRRTLYVMGKMACRLFKCKTAEFITGNHKSMNTLEKLNPVLMGIS